MSWLALTVVWAVVVVAVRAVVEVLRAERDLERHIVEILGEADGGRP